jgi:hypothetical protein
MSAAEWDLVTGLAKLVGAVLVAVGAAVGLAWGVDTTMHRKDGGR